MFPKIGLSSSELLREITKEWTGERFEDGRPMVTDDILERMKAVTIEEAWGTIRGKGYHHQFAGDWMMLHEDITLVGRAVTGAFTPARPDFQNVIEDQGKEYGCIGGQNSWVIDTMDQNDTIVIDLFGKIKDGTFAGDNLGNSIYAKTGTGMVIDGGIRDLQRLHDIPMASYVRGVDPSAINDVTLTGINIPIRIGDVTVIPGDVVLGTMAGIIFIPAHLAEQVVIESENTRTRDAWGHQMLRESKYTPGEIDREWSEVMEADFQEWKKNQ
ncbi:MAG: RraA family protein [Candidatus Latescibacteria bacterium]|nr:RraA family protein [Candidatus Latescibacterota bacterium]